nr:unnamed protein product [Callosobruchus chinensis]
MQCMGGDLSLFHRYSDGVCSPELTFIIPPLTDPARCTLEPAACHHKTFVVQTSRTERYDRTIVPSVSWVWNGLPGDVFIASIGLFKFRVNKLPST